jgi:hypothetical protein
VAEPAREAASPCRCGHAGEEIRCGCGSLLARQVDRGIELKCRRCKRTVIVPLTSG